MSQLDSKSAAPPTYQLRAGVTSGCWVPLDCQR